MPAKKEKADAVPKPERGKKGNLDTTAPDIFGGIPTSDLPVDFGEVSPVALHSIIARICRLGGYCAFSAPTGGNAVKLTVSVDGSTGQRWVHDGHELAAHLLHIHKLLDKLKPDATA